MRTHIVSKGHGRDTMIEIWSGGERVTFPITRVEILPIEAGSHIRANVTTTLTYLDLFAEGRLVAEGFTDLLAAFKEFHAAAERGFVPQEARDAAAAAITKAEALSL